MLYWPELRAMLDTKVYVQTDPAVCFQRRLRRDIAERGRTPESVREQYERTVRPSAEWFVYPTEKFADLVGLRRGALRPLHQRGDRGPAPRAGRAGEVRVWGAGCPESL